MKKLLSYILWPALAGLVFAAVLLTAPILLSRIPALASYVQQPAATPTVTSSPMVSFSAAIKKAAPAVVSINSLNLVERKTPAWYDRMFGAPDPQEQTSLGSGVIISPEGYIVTSYHVFFGGDAMMKNIESDITVTLSSGRTLDGKIVSLNEKDDLALLKVDQDNLPFLTTTDNPPEVGDVVLAIGNPRNLSGSVSFGIVSALRGRDESYFIQTDAAINPGNSGGALIDMSGNLLGINSTIVSESGGSEGISFAISAGNAQSLLNEYLSTSPGGYLGVDANTLSLDQARKSFNVDIQGFLVNAVTAGGPADRAGIEVNDVIIGVDGDRITFSDGYDRSEANRAISMISSAPAGTLVVIEVFRNGEFLQIPTILGVGRPNYSGVEPIEDASVPDTSNLVVPADVD